jgi:putative membrane protein
VIMKITQEIVYIVAIGIIFIKWVQLERLKDQEDLIQWEKDNILYKVDREKFQE